MTYIFDIADGETLVPFAKIMYQNFITYRRILNWNCGKQDNCGVKEALKL
jgi:hypothetical protein